MLSGANTTPRLDSNVNHFKLQVEQWRSAEVVRRHVVVVVVVRHIAFAVRAGNPLLPLWPLAHIPIAVLRQPQLSSNRHIRALTEHIESSSVM